MMCRYIVDFICFEKKVIIELDGGQHAEQVSYDKERQMWLEGKGFLVVRFWDNQVMKEIEAVVEAIFRALGC